MGKRLIVLVLAGLLFVPSLGAKEKDKKDKVGALGRIQPRNGIVHLLGLQGDRIAEILVKEGDAVKKGVPLVVFEGKASYATELSLAELASREADELGAKAVALQELRLREADELGAKAVAMQKQKIDAAQAEYDFALRRKNRFEGIDGQSLSAQQMDERESQAKITRAKLDSSKEELGRLVLSRELSTALARQELERLRLNRDITLDRARHQRDLAREKLERATLRAPENGTVLEVLQSVGETAGGRPIIRMADLEQMYVIAEIFEGDLLKISSGMKASITSSALPGPLQGEVESVGRVITGSSRTANVKVRLLDPKAASRLINMEVDISIEF